MPMWVRRCPIGGMRAARRFPNSSGTMPRCCASHDTPVSPHEIVGRFLRALGVPGDGVPADPDERVGRFRSELAGRRVLIVLDDARDEAQARMLLPGTADCAVVVTSRRRMDALLDAETHVVPVLAPWAARQLLADASGSARPARSAEAAARPVRIWRPR